MDFPAYVPAAVREHLAHYLEGESDRSIPGYIEILANAESRLTEIDGAIEKFIRRGEEDYLPGLRMQRAEAAQHRDRLARDVDCLRRLAHNPHMREAFALLTREFTDDQQWRGFIHSAWSAGVDFKKYRDNRKRAAELTADIANAAASLAKLIRQFCDTGRSAPDEFYSIPELLRQTDNHDMQGHNLEMWRAMRCHVLGDPPRRDAPEVEHARGGDDQALKPVIVIRTIAEPGEKPAIDHAQQQRETLRYAWGTAPDLPELLDTVASAARRWEPDGTGFIAAAIESRQRSAKTEFLRAFGSLLADTHHLPLTAVVRKAMAITANVVINLPGVDVTYDDVRKALAKLGGERLENSGDR